jgi:SAM-dependent methyltransferase
MQGRYASKCAADRMIYRAYNFCMRMAAGVYKRAYHHLRIAPVLNAVSREAVILEIGGGYNPVFTKDRYPNVYHLDHCDTAALQAKYRNDPLVANLVHRIQPVNFVANGLPIEKVVPHDLRFDFVFSSHALEHQVDLIGHFDSLQAVLKLDGQALMVIPDYRRCFDALRFPTLSSDAIAVYRRGRAVHSGRQIMDSMSRRVDLNPGRKLRAPDLSVARFNSSLRQSYRAMLASEQTDAPYEDVHAWVFSPESFELLLLELFMLELTEMRVTFISRPYGPQFFVRLERGLPFAAATASDVEKLERRRLTLTRRLRLR